MSTLGKAWYACIRAIVKWGYFKLTGGMHVSGAENVPRHGPLILAPNHASYLDPPLMGCALPRRLTFMAKEELFASPGFGWLIRSLGAFPIRRGAGDIESVRIALGILEREDALLVFPEGTRNDGQTMNPLTRGVFLLARKSGAPVLPTAIVGTAHKWGKGKKPKWGAVRVRYGELLHVADYPNPDAFLDELQQRIVALCLEEGAVLKTADQSSPRTTTSEAAPSSAPPLP